MKDGRNRQKKVFTANKRAQLKERREILAVITMCKEMALPLPLFPLFVNVFFCFVGMKSSQGRTEEKHYVFHSVQNLNHVSFKIWFCFFVLETTQHKVWKFIHFEKYERQREELRQNSLDFICNLFFKYVQ